MGQSRTELTVFISSPSDLSKERAGALRVIDRLNERPRVGGRFRLRALEYKRATPAVVGESAQTVVDTYMARAAECDIFVCMLWTRMGTPVVDTTTGEQFESGTHYEFTRAYQAYQQTKRRPRLLLYRCERALPIDVDLEQVGKVRAFFGRFTKTPRDLEGMIKSFEDVKEFEKELFDDLDTLLSKDFAPVEADDRSASAEPPVQDQAARRRYLETLFSDVENRLKTSIHSKHRLDVAADESLDTTSLPWEYQAKEDAHSFTSIDEVFAAFRGRFLLLGGPGSGKSTTLLYLAQKLLTQAIKDPKAPIPLLFNLSKFATFARAHEGPLRALVEKKHDQDDTHGVAVFEDWLTSLLIKYPGITTAIAERWIQEDRVGLLLDGLDELDDEWLERLAISLNRTYLHRHPDTVVVVCSRILEYDPLKQKEETRLNLRGAVTLKPLTRDQIDDYLEAAGATGLKTALAADAPLGELAQVPLTLSMMTLAYGGLSASAVPSDLSFTERRRHLFDTYIDRMMQRKARRDAGIPFDRQPLRDRPMEYSREQINRYLGWLAVRLSERMQTVFPYRQLHTFLALNKRSVWLPEGLYLAVCTAIALGPVILVGLSPIWYGVLVFSAALIPLLRTEPSAPVVKGIWTAGGILALAVLLIGGFGLLNASVIRLLPPGVSPYLSGLALLSLLTAALVTSVVAENASRRAVRGHIAVSITAPAIVIAVVSLAGWSFQSVAWAGVVALALVQLVRVLWQLRKEDSDAEEFLIAAGWTAGLLVAAIVAVRLVHSPDILHVALTITLVLGVCALGKLRPAMMLGTAVIAAVCAVFVGAHGIVPGAFIAIIGLGNLRVVATADAFIGRIVLDVLVRLESVTGSVPPRLHRLLRYSVDALLLKDVGQEYEFVHRLLRDHFATRELTPKLHADAVSEQLSAIRHLSRQGEAAIEPLAALLERPRAEIRAAAATALARIAAPAVTPHLVKAFADPSPEVRGSLVTAVAKLSLSISEPILKAGVTDADAAVRDAALRAVAKLDEYSRKDFLAQALASQSPEIDRQVLLLWPADARLPDPVPVRLLAYLEDADPRIRVSTIVACGSACTKAAPQVIRRLLWDADAGVRLKILEAIRFSLDSSEDFLDDFLDLYREPLKGTRASVRAWWRRDTMAANISAAVVSKVAYGLTDPRVANLVSDAIHDPRPVVRIAAAGALPLYDRAGGFETLIRMLRDRDDDVRAAAVGSLSRTLTAESAIPEVLPLLKDRSTPVRAAAAKFFGSVEFQPAVPQLLALLDDHNFGVRWDARYSLREMKDPEATEGLRAFLTRKEVSLSARVECAIFLAKAGDDHAMAWLEGHLSELDLYNRKRADVLLAERRGDVRRAGPTVADV